MTVKNVKQTSSGARLSVYGNSVDGSWSISDSTSKFGTFSELPLLGLTDAIQTGNSTGETASGETITLSSLALADYVKKVAKEGKSEVTFRLAAPLGGIRIYDTNTNTPPTLLIETGEVTTINVKTVYYDGDEIVDESVVTVGNQLVGDTYTYSDTPKGTIVKGEDVYTYSADKSTLSTEVLGDGSGTVILAYEKQTDVKSFYGYEIEDEGAWCWFGDPRAINFTNEEGTIDVTVIGYIDVHGSIKATQINNLTNKVDEVLIRTNIQPDDHNNPTFVMIPDGRIVVFYSRHTDEACFWYRVSEKPGDITTFGEEKCLETSANTTYPSPFILSDDPDHIYLCWRGIEWHPTIAKLSIPDENGDMEFTFGPYQLVRSTNAGSNVRPYAKYASNGKDKIYMSYTSTHPDNISDNWLYFNQIDINTMTLHDINGNLMRTIEQGPLIVDRTNQSHIVDKTSNVRNWLWQVALDEDGNPIIANVRIDNSKTSHDYYYVKWNGTEWVKTFLTNAGGKFHPSNTEYCYSGGMSIDVDNPNVIYVSKPVDGLFGKIWEVFKYTMSDDGKEVVSTEQITENSPKNNVRPWVIPNSEGKDLRVMWMHGDYDFWMVNSVYPAGYPTAIMGEVELPKEEVNLSDAVVAQDYDEIGGAFVATTETGNIVTDTSLDGSFTVSANVYLDGDYEGDIFDMGNMKLSVKNMPTKYGDDSEPLDNRPRVVLTLYPDTDFETEYVTSNVYGTSDEWQNHNIRTGGEYFFTKYDRFVNLTVTREDGYLTIYRDGLVEFKDGFRYPGPEKVWVGGFDGLVEDVYVYNRALNHDEIKALCIDYDVVYPDVLGTDTVTLNYVTSTGETLKESETVTLNPGTDYYNFKPEETIIVDGAVYKVCDTLFDGMTATAVYEKYKTKGANLVPDGSFEDSDGNFSWGTWQTPRTDGGYNNGYYKDTCGDWFYKVNRDTNASVLYETGNLTAEDYALGTRWNDGSTGTCSLANFIPVEAGKTYYVAYDYKHQTAGTDGTYISTSFVSEKTFSANASGNNIPVNVSTNWQTNEFAITAEEDGYIYFHFSWLGSSGNAGNGPYWYFDNFEVYELEKEAIKAEIVSVTANETTVKLTNVSAEDVEDIKVYVASYSANDELTLAESKTVTVNANDFETLTFNVGGDVKVFIWNANMDPICNKIEN
ncbi:MAG: BNR-4 repeat-containing protein [Clostridia bacterium]|nr:BNR-4 repeat-containing protein [Clostridia bacterium]